jgi:hypothetical protein
MCVNEYNELCFCFCCLPHFPWQDPESNPYALGNGVRYHMLQVEDWTERHGTGPSKRAQRPAVAVAAAATDAEGPDE